MDENIRLELEKEEVSPWHQQLLHHVRNLVEMSRRHMVTYYPRWDKADDTYRGLRQPDKSDAAAQSRDEPQRMVVPLTYSQIETFITFCIALFTQREHLFELVGVGEEDHKAAKLGEALIARDLTKNVYEARLRQFLLDMCRFGVGVMKTAWVEERALEMVKTEQGGFSLFGFALLKGRPKLSMEDRVKYQGNKIVNISPYHFFPDIRLPLARLQEGEFVASEDEYSMTSLHQMQRDGQVAGIQFVKPFTMKDMDARTVSTRLSKTTPLSDITASVQVTQSPGICVLTECQVRLIPNKFMIAGEPMGPEDYPVMWNVWYVNDKRIVKAEPMGYKHNQFTYSLAEFSPDQHNLLNAGLAETIDNLQAVVSWLINSHITSVRKTIQNWIIYDPAGVEFKDILERRPAIRLKPDCARQGVDKWVKQLQVNDVTAKHMEDAAAMQKTVGDVTGINDNAMGQFHSGRRSATEARNVNSATASRLKIQALLIFRTALEHQARQMLSNHQQGLDIDTFLRVSGELSDPKDFLQFKKVTKDDLVGDYDFEVFDGTLPSERGERAAAIEEFLVTLIKTPEAAPILGFDPVKLVLEWLELRGIRNPKRFLMDQLRQQQLAAQVQIMTGQQNELPPGGPGNVGSGAGTPQQLSQIGPPGLNFGALGGMPAKTPGIPGSITDVISQPGSAAPNQLVS